MKAKKIPSPVNRTVMLLATFGLATIIGDFNHHHTARAVTAFIDSDADDAAQHVLDLATREPEDEMGGYKVEIHQTYASQIGGWTAVILWVYDRPVKPEDLPVEAHGVRGMRDTIWRKSFPSTPALLRWAKSHDATIYATRPLDAEAWQEVTVKAPEAPLDNAAAVM